MTREPPPVINATPLVRGHKENSERLNASQFLCKLASHDYLWVLMSREAFMATAYVYFGKPINVDTTTALITACRTLAWESDASSGDPLWDKIHLTIASGGGGITQGFAAFNELKALPVELTTHNVGSVDSAAILIFMAGSKRLAVKASGFLFHESTWNFAGQGDVTLTTAGNTKKWLETYEGMQAEIVASRTGLQQDDVRKMMRDGTCIRSEEAVTLGLVDSVQEFALPRTARSWCV